MTRRRIWLGLLLLAAGVPAADLAATDLTRGEIVERVTCAKDPEISYALYLPSAYSAQTTWPIIWCISPGGNGLRPVQLLQPAAERYGYILVGAYDCRNGPWPATDRAMKAMARDIGKRFAIDPKRHYGIGLSGGARIILDRAIKERRAFRGVILCGAVNSPRRKLSGSGDLMIIGMVGDGDLALFEHLLVEEQLAGRFPQWHEVFVGIHQWPPQQLATEAVELLEAMAMLHGLKQRDEGFLEQLVGARMAAAEQLLASGQPLLALRKYRQTGALLAGVAGAERAASLAQELAQEPQVQQAQAIEEQFVTELSIVSRIAAQEEYEQAVRSLQARMLSSGEYARRARSALHLAGLYLSQSAWSLVQSGHLEQARDVFVAARTIYPDNPLPAYNAACMFLRTSGDTTSAMVLLKDAAVHRFDNLELLRSDTDLDPLRELPEFAEVERMVEQNQEQGLAPPPPPWTVEADEPGNPGAAETRDADATAPPGSASG
jgi:tetratricopeptide (TPR) repeat protein